MEACALNRCVYSSKSATCGIKVPYHEISMNEKLIVNALIKLASVLQFHAKLYRYSQGNVLALMKLFKNERVEPCINAQS